MAVRPKTLEDFPDVSHPLRDKDEICDVFSRYPAPLVGVISNCLVVVIAAPDHPNLPKTFRLKTPDDHKHIYIRPKGWTTEGEGEGVYVGGETLVYGPGYAYECDNTAKPFAEAPMWLEKILRKGPVPKITRAPAPPTPPTSAST